MVLPCARLPRGMLLPWLPWILLPCPLLEVEHHQPRTLWLLPQSLIRPHHPTQAGEKIKKVKTKRMDQVLPIAMTTVNLIRKLVAHLSSGFKQLGLSQRRSPLSRRSQEKLKILPSRFHVL
jgi:hypothetical protein